jgi:hypothetical protein
MASEAYWIAFFDTLSRIPGNDVCSLDYEVGGGKSAFISSCGSQ